MATTVNEGCPDLKVIYDSLERLRFYVLVCPEDLLKLMMIHCKLFGYHCCRQVDY